MPTSTNHIEASEINRGPYTKEEVKLLILQVLGLPMPSTMSLKAVAANCNQDGNPEAMAEVISEDHSLTGNILKIANSPDFGLSQNVATISRAMVVLGFDTIRSIALSTSVLDTLADKNAHEHFDRQRFWTHSLACAYLSRKIAGMTHCAELEVAFVSGLVHDIGKIIMDYYFPDSYRRVLERVASGTLTSVEAEDEILGFTHSEVGTWLAQQWKFSKGVVFSIANHHGMIVDDAQYKALTATIRLANHICSQEGVCLAEKVSVEPLENSIISDLKLEHDDLSDLKHMLAARKEAFASLIPYTC